MLVPCMGAAADESSHLCTRKSLVRRGAGVSPRFGLGCLATPVRQHHRRAAIYLRLRDRFLEPERYLYDHAEDDRCT